MHINIYLLVQLFKFKRYIMPISKTCPSVQLCCQVFNCGSQVFNCGSQSVPTVLNLNQWFLSSVLNIMFSQCNMLSQWFSSVQLYSQSMVLK